MASTRSVASSLSSLLPSLASTPLTTPYAGTTPATTAGDLSPVARPSSPTTLSSSHAHSTHGFATRAIHVGSEPELNPAGAVTAALNLSTTYRQVAPGQPQEGGFEYSRSSNPTRLALERQLASLEGAPSDGERPYALALASGSAATATVVQALAPRGGHAVSVGDVYGGTSRYLVRVAKEGTGLETTWVDLSYGGMEKDEEEEQAVLKRLKDAIREDTKFIWLETPTNPTLSQIDIPLITAYASSLDPPIPVVVDNTFASPFYQSPLKLGATVVTHSMTKYIGGHSDIVAGAIITSSPTLLETLLFLQNANGAVPSPFDAWLALRSIKTLALRAKAHGENALAVASYLDGEARREGLVREVYYPGLLREQESRKEKRERELAWRQLSSHARQWAESRGYSRETGFPWSGMVSFRLLSPSPASQTDFSTATTFLSPSSSSGLQVFALAESLGGVESLAELPLVMTHAGVARERREELGIDGELVRLSVGVEEKEDLVQDLRKALRRAVKGDNNHLKA